jgi:hypothetical protein
LTRRHAASRTFVTQQVGAAMQVQQFMLGVVMALVSLTSHGESVRACEKKPTKDAQYLCTAVAMVNPVVCEQIESRESMYYCKAMVANNSYGCEWSGLVGAQSMRAHSTLMSNSRTICPQNA